MIVKTHWRCPYISTYKVFNVGHSASTMIERVHAGWGHTDLFHTPARREGVPPKLASRQAPPHWVTYSLPRASKYRCSLSSLPSPIKHQHPAVGLQFILIYNPFWQAQCRERSILCSCEQQSVICSRQQGWAIYKVLKSYLYIFKCNIWVDIYC